MIDIPAHCVTREDQLRAAGISIAEVLERVGVDRSTWTGWKHRNISPRLSTLNRVEQEIERALANPAEYRSRDVQAAE